MLLSYAGFNPAGIDGLVGKLTRAAAQGFREAHGMGTSDEIDDELIDALRGWHRVFHLFSTDRSHKVVRAEWSDFSSFIRSVRNRRDP